MMKSESGSHETSLTLVMAENDRHRERLESERAREAARAESEHRERLAMYAAELEAKRRELAEMEGAPTIERPGKRLLQWMIPAAATVLVAYFAMLATGFGGAGGGRASAGPNAVASQAPEVAAPTEVAPAPVVEPEPVPEPAQVAPEPEPVKPVHVEHKQPKQPKQPKNPPLIVLDPGGDPLG